MTGEADNNQFAPKRRETFSEKPKSNINNFWRRLLYRQKTIDLYRTHVSAYRLAQADLEQYLQSVFPDQQDFKIEIVRDVYYFDLPEKRLKEEQVRELVNKRRYELPWKDSSNTSTVADSNLKKGPPSVKT